MPQRNSKKVFALRRGKKATVCMFTNIFHSFSQYYLDQGRNLAISEGGARNELGVGGSPSEAKRTRRGVQESPCIRTFLEFALKILVFYKFSNFI